MAKPELDCSMLDCRGENALVVLVATAESGLRAGVWAGSGQPWPW